MKIERIYFRWARVAIAATCMFATVMVDAGGVSAGVKAPKMVSAISKKIPVRKIIIDGAKAIDKNGKKIYRAIDIADDSIGIGKGMLGKLADGVTDDVIKDCAEYIGKNEAGENVRQVLEKVVKRSMTAKERNLLLNDAYLRVAQRAGRITAEEADDAFRLLKDTEGLDKLIRSCYANNKSVTGALYEFRQALAFQKKGFNVIGLDLKYAYPDGITSRRPDVDLLLKKGNSLFLVECKHYTDPKWWETAPTTILKKYDGLLNLKAYLNSEYGESLNIKPFFAFLNDPPPDLAKQLAEKGVHYLVGNAEELAERLSALQ